ncbi:Uncharacterised protein [Leclercia adecarboxylata]|uniref:Uncharacterized protein n=1 Tax=Leclercia adecarboxylata TaxID=83655 RepID=A0A4U9ILX0_9ENTR|nr:Uncharacterised protein [Leclercia adecarboxylata]
MSVLDLNALNEQPKVERILALAENQCSAGKAGRGRACRLGAGKPAW